MFYIGPLCYNFETQLMGYLVADRYTMQKSTAGYWLFVDLAIMEVMGLWLHGICTTLGTNPPFVIQSGPISPYTTDL